MLRKRSSFFSSGSKFNPKRTPAPSPKPGRTLVMTSTSSTLELDNIAEESFLFDFEKPRHGDEFTSKEPLFFDFFLPSCTEESPRTPQPHPQIPEEVEEAVESSTPVDVPSLRSSIDLDDDSDDADDALETYINTLPAAGLVAKCISVIYSGRPTIVDVPRLRLSSHRPYLQPLQTRSGHTSRASSVSTRDDFPLSPGRFSDDGSKSSPASSVSDFSNVAVDTIPEDSPSQPRPYAVLDAKPFRRSHRRNISSTSSGSFTSELKPSSMDRWGIEKTSDFGSFDLNPLINFKRQAHYGFTL